MPHLLPLRGAHPGAALRPTALALAAALQALSLSAGAQASSMETVIVTGTRAVGTKATQSSSPIAVVTAEDLAKTGQASVLDALLRVEPAFAALAKGGDLANMVRAATLRGLSANQTLVLVNGKRRNGTAMISTGGGQFGGASGVDLDLIPTSAIARVEILKDGAAAQYGSDAIAGVMNIILKTDTNGSFEVNWGLFADSKVNPNGMGNGRTRGLIADKGIALGEDGYMHFSAEYRDHLNTNQTGPENRVINSNPAKYGGPVDPYAPNTQGDPAYSLLSLAYNAGYNVKPNLELYSYATLSNRNAFSWQNLRPLQLARANSCFVVPGTSTVIKSNLPGVSTDVGCTSLDVGGLAKAYYPEGYFIPKESISEEFASLAVGAKGHTPDDRIRWDLSLNYGRDTIDIGVSNSLNYAHLLVPIGGSVAGGPNGVSPTSAYIGQYHNSQLLANFDVGTFFDIGLATPLDVSVGVEARRDTYGIFQGDTVSWSNGGLQAFVGMSPLDQGEHSRSEVGGYIDMTTNPVKEWTLALAARTERYSDFGAKSTGKLSTRYDFSKAFALRGTYSTGFRAPTLPEQYFTTTTVGPTTANVILPPGSAAAAVVGGAPLKPETSKNISLGMIFTPSRDWRFTLDAYEINIKDRITNVSVSSSTSAALAALVRQAIALRGVVVPATASTLSVQFAANRIDMTTKGIDLSAGTTTQLGTGLGKIDWTLAANFRKIDIDKADPAIFNPATLWALTKTPVPNKFVLTADWSLGAWKSTARLSRYGETSALAVPSNASYLTYATVRPELALESGYIKQVVPVAYIVDVEASYEPAKSWRLIAGVNNLFNKTPPKTPDLLLYGDPKVNNSVANSTGVGYYTTNTPYGINGAYYYAKAQYKF